MIVTDEDLLNQKEKIQQLKEDIARLQMQGNLNRKAGFINSVEPVIRNRNASLNGFRKNENYLTFDHLKRENNQLRQKLMEKDNLLLKFQNISLEAQSKLTELYQQNLCLRAELEKCKKEEVEKKNSIPFDKSRMYKKPCSIKYNSVGPNNNVAQLRKQLSEMETKHSKDMTSKDSEILQLKKENNILKSKINFNDGVNNYVKMSTSFTCPQYTITHKKDWEDFDRVFPGKHFYYFEPKRNFQFSIQDYQNNKKDENSKHSSSKSCAIENNKY